MLELALADQILDTYYYLTEPFASPALKNLQLTFMIAPQVLPAVVCFYLAFSITMWGPGAAHGANQINLQLFRAPFDWTIADLGTFEKAINHRNNNHN